jgi:hypothetical protein
MMSVEVLAPIRAKTSTELPDSDRPQPDRSPTAQPDRAARPRSPTAQADYGRNAEATNVSALMNTSAVALQPISRR